MVSVIDGYLANYPETVWPKTVIKFITFACPWARNLEVGQLGAPGSESLLRLQPGGRRGPQSRGLGGGWGAV